MVNDLSVVNDLIAVSIIEFAMELAVHLLLLSGVVVLLVGTSGVEMISAVPKYGE